MTQQQHRDKFLWRNGDIVVTPCPECERLAQAMLDAPDTSTLDTVEQEYAEHAETHDVPRRSSTAPSHPQARKSTRP